MAAWKIMAANRCCSENHTDEGPPARVTRKPSKLAGSPSRGSTEVHRTGMRSILASAGAQTKVEVGPATDKYEREADRVGEKVAAGLPAPMISRLPATGMAPVGRRVDKREEEGKKKLQRKTAHEEEGVGKVQRKTTESRREEDKRVQRAVKREEEDKNKKVQRATQKEEDEKKRVQRAAKREDEDRKPVQRSSDDTAASYDDLADAATRAIESKGAGRPLEPATRDRLELSMGVDLGAVRVHDDPAARVAAQSLNARAFTHGNDIWLGPGESQSDIRLMAHEATHVVQQQSGLMQRMVQRTAKAGGGAGGVLSVDKLYMPKLKHRLLEAYQNWKPLERVKKFERGKPDQKDSVWLKAGAIQLPAAKILNQLDLDISKSKDLPEEAEVLVGGKRVTLGADHDVIEDLKVPLWNAKGEPVSKGAQTTFEVDHKVELQVAGWPDNPKANSLDNLELLDRKSNGYSGGDFNRAIRVSIAAQLEKDGVIGPKDSDETKKQKVRDVLNKQGARFAQVSIEAWPNKLYEPKGDELAAKSAVWSKSDIENGAHIDLAKPAEKAGEMGSPDKYALLLPARSEKLGEFKQDKNNSAQQIVIPEGSKKSILGLTLTGISLKEGYKTAKAEEKVGSLDVELDAGSWSEEPMQIPSRLAIKRHEK